MHDYLTFILVDFDNTICAFREDFKCEQLVPGSKEGIARLREAGYKVTIHSARNNVIYGGHIGTPYKLMVDFLEREGIEYDRLDCGRYGKPIGYMHVDDKSVGCPLNKDGCVDWGAVCKLLDV